jgi:phage recombination protein Bet
MANRLQVSPAQLQKTLQATAFKECKTNEEFIASVIVANNYQLNPLLGEIYAFPSKKGGVTPIVPIDGWIKLMNTHKDAAGNFDHDGIEMTENRSDKSKLKQTDVVSITAKIYTKGKTYPTVVTEYMDECYNGAKQPWVQWPVRMLRHKALIQCARVAYGFSGIYDPDEGERIIEAQIVSGIKDPASIQMPQPKAVPQSVDAGDKDNAQVTPPADGLSQEEKDEIEKQEAIEAQKELDARKKKAVHA